MQTVNIFSALLTPIIAILAIYIAYQQYLINKRNSERQYFLGLKKINLDLYQKRFRIFDETKQILLKINKDAEIDIIKFQDFSFSINECNFLFGNEIIQYLQELQKNAINLTHSTKELKNVILFPVNSKERKKLIDRHKVLIDWFTLEYEHVEDRFVKYLDFKNL